MTPAGVQVGAILGVHALGSPVMPGTDTLYAYLLEQGDELGGQPVPPASLNIYEAEAFQLTPPGTNTTIGVVATNVTMTKTEATRLASSAHLGMAHAPWPVHTMADGDTLFVLSTGQIRLDEEKEVWLTEVGSLAADCVARAIARAVYAAETIDHRPSYRDKHGHALRRRA